MLIKSWNFRWITSPLNCTDFSTWLKCNSLLLENEKNDNPSHISCIQKQYESKTLKTSTTLHKWIWEQSWRITNTKLKEKKLGVDLGHTKMVLWKQTYCIWAKYVFWGTVVTSENEVGTWYTLTKCVPFFIIFEKPSSIALVEQWLWETYRSLA